METTNELLDRLLLDLEVLRGWAEADKDASNESNAKDQARDDEARAKLINRAILLLRDCYK